MSPKNWWGKSDKSVRDSNADLICSHSPWAFKKWWHHLSKCENHHHRDTGEVTTTNQNIVTTKCFTTVVPQQPSLTSLGESIALYISSSQPLKVATWNRDRYAMATLSKLTLALIHTVLFSIKQASTSGVISGLIVIRVTWSAHCKEGK